MTRKKKHRGLAYVEPVVRWIVYRPGKREKKHEYSALYLTSIDNASATSWSIDKRHAIRFLSRDAAECPTNEWRWQDQTLQIVPSDTVTT